MKNVKIVFMSFLVMMLAGSAWAAGPSDHVKIAPNNQGDVLIYPFYAAIDGGYETKLTVVNTSDTLSTVAKLVVRSEEKSEELLDFLIYLSPSDVWTGTLRWDAEEGGPVMYSEDDSVLSDIGVWANTVDEDTGELKPMNQPLADASAGGNMMGYVYVINAASADLDDPDSSGDRVSKDVIHDWYEGVTSADIREEYQPENILAGFMDFSVEDAFLTSGLNAVALRDYENRQALTVLEPTFLGEGANNTLFEIEAILSKTDVSIPYLNNDEDVTLHFFNFPTKYAQVDSSDDAEAGVKGEFFRQNTEGPQYCVPFGFNAYDLSENTESDPSPIYSPAPPKETSSFCRELNWIDSPQFPYEEGFTRYNFKDEDFFTESFVGEQIPLGFTGAPVIPMQLNLGQSGLSMQYGAWTDGIVTNTDTDEIFTDYHYSDTPNVEVPE